MAYSAEVLADSISEEGYRLTTLEATFPRFVLAEFNTHRVFSRNSASSRAIPTWKRIQSVLDDPVLPLEWGANKPGMQANEILNTEDIPKAESDWLISRDIAVLGALALIGGINMINSPQSRDKEAITALKSRLSDLKERYQASFTDLEGTAHKQVVNRLLEPFLWHTVVVTSTEWENFYALRKHPAAQPEIRYTAELMDDAMEASKPAEVSFDEWHLPFVTEQEKRVHDVSLLTKLCVARCARVSYETHDTSEVDMDKDVILHNALRDSGHMSPFEHAARPMTVRELDTTEWSGNFRGWHQYRKDIPNEGNYAEAN